LRTRCREIDVEGKVDIMHHRRIIMPPPVGI
jgi:hypothetical protein